MAHDSARIWCNLGDTSEAGGLLSMLERLRDRKPKLTAILTGGRSVRLPARLPDGVETAPKPYDLPQSVDRFLGEQNPDLALLTGSDLFPSAISSCRQKGIPMVLANASFRDRGMLQERLLDFRLGARLKMFDSILAVKTEDVHQFLRKGAPRERIRVLGVLEAVDAPSPCDEEERNHLEARLATRPVWLAVGLPEEELPAVEHAFRTANGQTHRLLLVVVPADLSKGDAFCQFFEGAGWVSAQRENGEEPDGNVQVYVADAPDEAGLWFRLASMTYLGGTLSGKPYVDPFHPAALGSAVIHGTHRAVTSPRLERLLSESATRTVKDAGDLAIAIEELLSPDRAAVLANRAWDVSSRGAEAADEAADVICKILDGRTK